MNSKDHVFIHTCTHTWISMHTYINTHTNNYIHIQNALLWVSLGQNVMAYCIKPVTNKNNNKEQHTPIAFSILKIIHIEFAFQRIMFPSRKYCEIRHFIRTSLEYINTCRLINKQYLMLVCLHSSYIFQIYF